MDAHRVTLRIPKALLTEAQKVATARGINLQTLVVEGLVRLTDEAYEEAWARQRTMMHSARRLRDDGGAFSLRDALHER